MSTDKVRPDLEGQRRFAAEWLRAKKNKVVPLRSDLRIENFFPDLGHVSILQRGHEGFIFRLTGSALRGVLKTDPRGHAVDGVEVCRAHRAWTDIVETVISDCVPKSGRDVWADGGVHVWVRLPLSSGRGQVDMVLCYDRVVLPEDKLSDTSIAGARRVGSALERAA